jgi:hypothetical protein
LKKYFSGKIVFIKKNICIEFIMNANWNEELNLFWMRQIQDFKLYHMHNYFKLIAFNNQ